MWESIIVAAITGVLSLIGVFVSNRKSAALWQYRLQKLEEQVAKHNNLVERMYRCEERTELQEAELKRQNERLKVLEGGKR